MCKVSRQQEKVVNYVFESPFTALDSAASFFRLKQMLDRHDDVVTQNSEQEARQQPGVDAVFCHRGRETEPSCAALRARGLDAGTY